MTINIEKVILLKGSEVLSNGSKFRFNKDINRVISLNNDVEIPLIGIGTGIISLGGTKSVIADIVLRRGKEVKNACKLKKVIQEALALNCIMFDTSKAYGKSEQILGNAIKEHKRKNVFVITKLTNTDQRKGNVRQALIDSMKTMGVDYIDLFLMHWPQTDTYLNCWVQMEELYKEGLVRAIGVSNFHKHHLDKLLSIASVVPAINEIERHPLLSQEELINYCEKHGIRIIAYTPIGRMHEKLNTNPTLIDLSRKHQKTIAQIILRWHFQQEVISIPHTFKVERLREYINIFDFELSEDDMIEINNINENFRLRYNPDNCDFSKL